MNNTVGIFTDAHGLLEPTEAVIEDMHKSGITKIYSLGDNIGVGPNPCEVIDLLDNNNVISIAGNSEEYCNLGIEPFSGYFDFDKRRSQAWTKSQLGKEELHTINMYPHSIEMVIGNKKIALCHFSNDIRCDYWIHDTYGYKRNRDYGLDAYKQFLYTNSLEQQKEINSHLNHKEENLGYKSAHTDPLFGGKPVTYYDTIFQGHVHYKIFETSPTTNFYTLRAVGMPCGDNLNTAYYISLSENNGDLEVNEHYVPYDREKMEYSIIDSKMPDRTIERFTGMRRY